MSKDSNNKSNGFSEKEVSKITEQAQELMDYFLEAFDVDVKTDYEMKDYEDEEGVRKYFLKINIDGEDLGILIGYRGRNLKSFQRVFMMILNRRVEDMLGEDRFMRVVIDVSGYRENRRESLRDMAERIRREVVESGESVDMPPMTSYERRVIHVHLSHFSDVTTESFGKGSDRHVKVLPVADVGDDIEETEKSDADEADSTDTEEKVDEIDDLSLDLEDELDI
jgi:spoIIIJ-associated protein